MFEHSEHFDWQIQKLEQENKNLKNSINEIKDIVWEGIQKSGSSYEREKILGLINEVLQ